MAKGKKSAAQDLVDQVAGPMGEVPEGFEVVSKGGNPFKAPGDAIRGIYTGPGEPLKLKGKKPIPTFKVGALVLLASAQLADFFAGTEEGTEVWIRFDGQKPGGKGRVNTYTMARRAS